MILNGKVAADNIKQQLKKEILESGTRPPHLTIITVGEDPASQVYVKNKKKACEEIGINVGHIVFNAGIPTYEIKETIRYLNDDNNIDGIMVQLPLPQGYNEREIIDIITPSKDVDGLTTINIGKLRSVQPCFQPCTARGIMDLLNYHGISVDGKDVTIIGRSNIVGKPLADLMMANGATVTQCHSRTSCLSKHTIHSDIIVSAIGCPKKLSVGEIPAHSIVIDVGINRDENNKLCGDVDYDAVEAYCDAITPVPGGVGPMTVVELLRNTVEAWRRNI